MHSQTKYMNLGSCDYLIKFSTAKINVFTYKARYEWIRNYKSIDTFTFIGPSQYFNVHTCWPPNTRGRRVEEEVRDDSSTCIVKCTPPCFQFGGECRPRDFCEFKHRSLCEKRKGMCEWKENGCGNVI
jgi:hypothetical protein